MGDITVTVLLSFLGILLTINLFILKGIREDFKALWEKIEAMVEKHDHTLERLIRAEAEIASCSRERGRRSDDNR